MTASGVIRALVEPGSADYDALIRRRAQSFPSFIQSLQAPNRPAHDGINSLENGYRNTILGNVIIIGLNGRSNPIELAILAVSVASANEVKVPIGSFRHRQFPVGADRICLLSPQRQIRVSDVSDCLGSGRRLSSFTTGEWWKARMLGAAQRSKALNVHCLQDCYCELSHSAISSFCLHHRSLVLLMIVKATRLLLPNRLRRCINLQGGGQPY